MRTPPERRRGWLRALLPTLLLGAATSAAGCLYDADDRCGENQRLDGQQCVCEDGHGREGMECVACSDTEAGNPVGPCQCKPGLLRLVEGGDCIEAAGKVCQSDEDCPAGEFGTCRLEGDAGYCTSLGCAAEAGECPGDFACNDREDPPYCERPPTGLGTSCSESADCDDFEASYCETLAEKVCLVADCAEDPSICHGDWVCCDIGLIGTSLCIPPGELSDGNCPVGGTLVSR